MRTAIILSAIIIAYAINPKISETNQNINAYGFILLITLVVDILVSIVKWNKK
ncbi:MAG: hypothetical protein ACC656_13945 [Candidatus Heimdallarchaeota archaeon]